MPTSPITPEPQPDLQPEPYDLWLGRSSAHLTSRPPASRDTTDPTTEPTTGPTEPVPPLSAEEREAIEAFLADLDLA